MVWIEISNMVSSIWIKHDSNEKTWHHMEQRTQGSRAEAKEQTRVKGVTKPFPDELGNYGSNINNIYIVYMHIYIYVYIYVYIHIST